MRRRALTSRSHIVRVYFFRAFLGGSARVLEEVGVTATSYPTLNRAAALVAEHLAYGPRLMAVGVLVEQVDHESRQRNAAATGLWTSEPAFRDVAGDLDRDRVT